MKWSMAVTPQRDLIHEGECANPVIDAMLAARPALEMTVPLKWSMDVFTRRDLSMEVTVPMQWPMAVSR